jgi:peptide/nickel transport system permease protein
VTRPGGSAALIAGGALTLLLIAAALLSHVWLPYLPTAMDIPHRLEPPSPAHPFGTDSYGRDVLSILMAGARTALDVALAASVLGMGAGVPLGLIAAARPGIVAEMVMRAGDVVFAFPTLLVAVLIAAVAGPGLFSVVAAIGLFNIPVFARVTRAAALGLWQRDFVLAARAAGRSAGGIAWRHIMPNLLGTLLVQGAIQFSLAVLAEAGLSYVGLGIQPPQPSWGRMLQEAQTLATAAPWLVLFPGLAVVLTVLGLNLLGDGLRDRLDPRLAGPLEEDR